MVVGVGSRWRPRHIPDGNWRQQSRRGRSKIYQKKRDSARWIDLEHFQFELRFGPYSPEIDEEFEGKSVTIDGTTYTTPPFTDYFGDDPLFYFGLELDWLPFYIPYVGSLGIGAGWGHVRTSANTRTEADHGTEAASETSITIMPMHLSGVVRIDGPLREAGFPVVPYAKLGFGFGLWTASGPDGTSDAGGVSGEGTSVGPSIALGGAIALNAFDESQAVSLREDTGIRYAYVFGEWYYANLDSGMHVGSSTAVFGLALDF